MVQETVVGTGENHEATSEVAKTEVVVDMKGGAAGASEAPQSADAVVSTIDGFQGREADVCIFSTVRANIEGDIGFVEDARRLNVAWTRPKLGLIVVGSRSTLIAHSALWKRALEACQEVEIQLPEA